MIEKEVNNSEELWSTHRTSELDYPNDSDLLPFRPKLIEGFKQKEEIQ